MIKKAQKPLPTAAAAIGSFCLFEPFVSYGLQQKIKKGKLNMAQIAAVIIFLAMFLLILSEKLERHIIALGCALLTMVVVFGLCMRSFEAFWQTLNIGGIFTQGFWYTAAEGEEATTGINWSTIIFVLGMMIMVEGMARSGFFRWLCLRIAKAVKYKTIPIFISFMIMSAVLAMFIDSITVILFLAAVTIELASMLKFDPAPMILAEIFCANLGGSSTMCGDPPNIIIGTSLGYTFFDFITNTGLAAFISLIFTVIYFYFFYRKDLKTPMSEAQTSYPDPSEAITDKKGFILSSLIFALAVILLVTHAATGLTVALIGVIISILTLLAAGKEARSLIKKVDYKTLLFFIGLFVVVGGLEQTGILEIIASFIAKISGGSTNIMIAIILWVSAVASAFIDNIPFAATMIPVIKSLAATQGADLSTFAWTLSIGTDIGGSATPIGASANVVGTAVSAKAGHPIGWKKYCKAAFPATAIVLIISMAYIYIRY